MPSQPDHPGDQSSAANGHAAAATPAVRTIDVTPRTWSEVVPVLIAVLTDGDAAGVRLATAEIRRMASVADLGMQALHTLSARSDEPADGDNGDTEVGDIVGTVDRTDSAADRPSLEGASAQQPVVFGKLALQTGRELPLQILQSAAGFYLGTFGDEGPYTRESQQYWRRRQDAEVALERGSWTQREWL